MKDETFLHFDRSEWYSFLKRTPVTERVEKDNTVCQTLTATLREIREQRYDYLTIIRRRRSDSPRRSRGEYSPIITSPEANNCFSVNTQVNISKKKREREKKKKKHFNAKSSSLTVAKRLLVAILSVEVIIG